MFFADRRPMRRNEDSIQLASAIQGGEHRFENRIKGLGGDRSVRDGSAGKDRHRFHLFLFETVQEAACLVMRANHVFADRLAGKEPVLPEVLQRGGLRDERVGLVKQCDDADAHIRLNRGSQTPGRVPAVFSMLVWCTLWLTRE